MLGFINNGFINNQRKKIKNNKNVISDWVKENFKHTHSCIISSSRVAMTEYKSTLNVILATTKMSFEIMNAYLERRIKLLKETNKWRETCGSNTLLYLNKSEFKIVLN